MLYARHRTWIQIGGMLITFNTGDGCQASIDKTYIFFILSIKTESW